MENYYLLIYHEPLHNPIYVLTTETTIEFSHSFKTTEEFYNYAKKIKNIEKKEIITQIEPNLFKQIKKNLGYEKFPFVLTLNGLEEKLLRNN